MTPPTSPPMTAIAAACLAAAHSPCVKSKRGAVLFHPHTGLVTLGMWNARPDNLCDKQCQPRATDKLLGAVPLVAPPSRCSMLCVHAEVRALRVAGYISERSHALKEADAFILNELELVHAKVSGPRADLVPSGGPSCWQCAKEIADTGILGVWLYETVSFGMEGVQDRWNFYTNKQFYDLTMKECRLAGNA